MAIVKILSIIKSNRLSYFILFVIIVLLGILMMFTFINYPIEQRIPIEKLRIDKESKNKLSIEFLLTERKEQFKKYKNFSGTFSNAIQYINKKEYYQAISQFKQILLNNQISSMEKVQAQLKIVECYIAKKDYSEALNVIEQIWNWDKISANMPKGLPEEIPDETWKEIFGFYPEEVGHILYLKKHAKVGKMIQEKGVSNIIQDLVLKAKANYSSQAAAVFLFDRAELYLMKGDLLKAKPIYELVNKQFWGTEYGLLAPQRLQMLDINLKNNMDIDLYFYFFILPPVDYVFVQFLERMEGYLQEWKE